MTGDMRKFSWFLPLLVGWCLVVLVFFFYNFHEARQFVINPLDLTENSEKSTKPAVDNVTDLAEERTNIFFLKTHKCGSSTIQNILMRFGYSHHLEFVLPDKNNYLGHPPPFHPRFISPRIITSPNLTFNIFTHHTRYNYTAVKTVMKADAAFVTILREPSDLFESIYNYYHLERYLKNKSLENILTTPELWPTLKDRKTLKKFGANQMSFDLGYDTGIFVGESDPLSDFIDRIDREFDLVMIMEYMEASLVLLCELMNWPLENVRFVRLNARQPTQVVKLNPSERQTLLEINLIDTELYDYFLAKFKQRVKDFGPNRMKQQVEKLLKLNSDLMRNCVDKPNYNGYAKTLGYDLRSRDFTCYFATKNELAFTELIREDQISRASVMRKLDALIADTGY